MSPVGWGSGCSVEGSSDCQQSSSACMKSLTMNWYQGRSRRFCIFSKPSSSMRPKTTGREWHLKDLWLLQKNMIKESRNKPSLSCMWGGDYGDAPWILTLKFREFRIWRGIRVDGDDRVKERDQKFWRQRMTYGGGSPCWGSNWQTECATLKIVIMVDVLLSVMKSWRVWSWTLTCEVG